MIFVILALFNTRIPLNTYLVNQHEKDSLCVKLLKCVNIESDIDIAILDTNIDIVLFSNIVQP